MITTDSANIELIEAIAVWGVEQQLFVIVEGILNASRYQRVLERLRSRAGDSSFFAWDLEFTETARRHALRPQRSEFSVAEMAEWYHGWQPLDFVIETPIDASTSAAQAADLIIEKFDSNLGSARRWL